MPITELKGGEDAGLILQAAYALSHGEDPDHPIQLNQGDNTEEIEEEVEIVPTEEDVDNDESEVAEQEDDEDYVESEDEEDEEEQEEEDEPEDGSYDTGYTYFDEKTGKVVFLSAEDSESGEKSIYLNRVEAEKGIARQLAYIAELKRQVENDRNKYDADISKLRKDLQIYELTAKPDQIRDALIKDKMPEKFRNVDPKTLADEAYQEFRQSRLDAEISVERELRSAQDAQEKADREAKEAERKAEDHIKNRSNDTTFFGLTNTEDKYVVNKRLKEVPEGSQYSYSDMATSIAKAFGSDIADKFLLAVVQDIISVETPPKTKTPEADKSKDKGRRTEEVQKLKKKVKVKKPVASSNGSKPSLPANPRDMMNAAFAMNSKGSRK